MYKYFILWGVALFLCAFNVHSRLKILLRLAGRIPIYTVSRRFCSGLFQAAGIARFSRKPDPALHSWPDVNGWLTRRRCWLVGGGNRLCGNQIIPKLSRSGLFQASYGQGQDPQVPNLSSAPIIGVGKIPKKVTRLMAERLHRHWGNRIFTQESDFYLVGYKNGKMQQFKLKCGI